MVSAEAFQQARLALLSRPCHALQAQHSNHGNPAVMGSPGGLAGSAARRSPAQRAASPPAHDNGTTAQTAATFIMLQKQCQDLQAALRASEAATTAALQDAAAEKSGREGAEIRHQAARHDEQRLQDRIKELLAENVALKSELAVRPPDAPSLRLLSAPLRAGLSLL